MTYVSLYFFSFVLSASAVQRQIDVRPTLELIHIKQFEVYVTQFIIVILMIIIAIAFMTYFNPAGSAFDGQAAVCVDVCLCLYVNHLQGGKM